MIHVPNSGKNGLLLTCHRKKWEFGLLRSWLSHYKRISSRSVTLTSKPSSWDRKLYYTRCFFFYCHFIRKRKRCICCPQPLTVDNTFLLTKLPRYHCIMSCSHLITDCHAPVRNSAKKRCSRGSWQLHWRQNPYPVALKSGRCGLAMMASLREVTSTPDCRPQSQVKVTEEPDLFIAVNIRSDDLNCDIHDESDLGATTKAWEICITGSFMLCILR